MFPDAMIKRVAFDSDDRLLLVDLRRRVLRIPLGLDFSEDELLSEASQLHIAAFKERELIGCVMLLFTPEGDAKLRQMAVEPAYQRKGIGQALLAYAEGEARKQGAHQIILHARTSAADFYAKVQYQPIGQPFTEVTLPHIKMVKELG